MNVFISLFKNITHWEALEATELSADSGYIIFLQQLGTTAPNSFCRAHKEDVEIDKDAETVDNSSLCSYSSATSSWKQSSSLGMA